MRVGRLAIGHRRGHNEDVVGFDLPGWPRESMAAAKARLACPLDECALVEVRG